jgi:hypothetical protein
VLPRLQRGANGQVIARNWNQQAQLGGQQPAARLQPAQLSTSVNPQRFAGQYPQDAWKRGAGRFKAVNGRPVAPRANLNAANPNRMAGQFNQNAWKRGAGRFKAVNPKATTRLAGGSRVGTGAAKKFLKRAGTAGAVVGGAGLVAGAVSQGRQLDADLREGRITQAQYNRAQATNALNVAGGALAIKKMNPASMAMNVAIGTDPISLGVDAVGDLINGTNNAQKSIDNIGRTLDGHAKGVEKLATNPAGWAQDTGKNIENTAKDVGKAAENTAKDVGNFVGGIFGGK